MPDFGGYFDVPGEAGINSRQGGDVHPSERRRKDSMGHPQRRSDLSQQPDACGWWDKYLGNVGSGVRAIFNRHELEDQPSAREKPIAKGAVEFEAVDFRYPDGADDFYPLTARTPGLSNSSILVRDIVINEIMYEPISGNSDDQYIELYNRGANAVNIGGWRFTSGINFAFPTNTTLGTNSYLVIARNATNLIAHYATLNTNNTLGDFGGNLAGGCSRRGPRPRSSCWRRSIRA